MEAYRKQFKAGDGTDISYADIGTGQPFLWIHGWGGNAESQVPLLQQLSKRGFRCLCFDQRGCGETPYTDGLGVPQSAKDAKELLEHLSIDNAIMIGYSMGAAVLFSYLEQFGTLNLSKIIIGEMSPKPLNDDEWKFGLYQGWYKENNLEQDLYDMEHDYKKFAIYFSEQTIFMHTPDEVRDFKVTQAYIDAAYQRADAENKRKLLDQLMIVPTINAKANRIYWESCDRRDFRGIFDKIDVPTALFYAIPGSIYDPKTAYWMATKIKDVRLYCFENCSHMARLESPELFVDSVVKFAAI